MNVRIKQEPTPAGRIAAVVRALIVRTVRPYPNMPDYADIRDAIELYCQREALIVRVDEARRSSTYKRALELQQALTDIEKRIDQLFADLQK